MKKTLLFLFCGIAALCVSCKEGDDAATRFSFSLPEVVSVGSTTADVNSRAGFTLNDYPGLERGFAYGPADEAAEDYRTVKVTEFERNAISARLTGLDPETSYRVHAYVKLGASRILSDGAEHHCPVWVAAPRHACYEGTANRTNAYKADPDIPSGIQYYGKAADSGCNNGHMLGSAERTYSRAVNEQVFYFSNIAPQYSSGFNTGGGGWNLLEDWIDTKVCTDTTYLVIGTYFDRYEDRYGNTASPKKISFGNRNDVSCPTMFYIAVLRTKKGNTGKSVMECSADELMCAAFVRCHNNALKGKQVSSKDMYSIAELEELTGFTYFPNVPNAPKDSYKASDWGL